MRPVVSFCVCVRLILLVVLPGVIGCSFYQTAQLSEKVHTRIVELRPPLRNFALDVVARSGGEVEIGGTVASEKDRTRVVATAKSVEGVTSVIDRLSLQPDALGYHDGGSQFETAIINRLEEELVGAQYSLQVADQGADIVISGEVDSHLTKLKVVEIAKSVVGSQVKIHDGITLVKAPTDDWIKGKVTTELSRRFPTWADRVSVSEVKSGVVTLKGSLDDHWDIDAVLAVVVMVPGVRDLRSEITMQGQPYSSAGTRQ